jgi:hypothetical protein
MVEPIQVSNRPSQRTLEKRSLAELFAVMLAKSEIPVVSVETPVAQPIAVDREHMPGNK